jgi:hypothetical protein
MQAATATHCESVAAETRNSFGCDVALTIAARLLEEVGG